MKIRRLMVVICGAIFISMFMDLALFPSGNPRDLPFLRWAAKRDSYIYNLLPRPEKQFDEYRVCLIGSSLVEKGIHAPTLQRVLTDSLGRSCNVYNYSIGGSYFCDFLLSVHRAEIAEPDLIVIGTSWRDLVGDKKINPKQTAVYQLLYDDDASLPDFLKKSSYEEIVDYNLGEFWSTYRYRNWLKANSWALFNALITPQREKNPDFFEGPKKIEWLKLRQKVKSQYERSERIYPNKQTECMSHLLTSTSLTKKLVVNLPVSSLWQEEDPDTMRDDAWKHVKKEVERAGARYLDASAICNDSLFFDSRHLDKQGALFFTQWLADEIMNIEGSY